jgi:hypothetical protein
MDMLTDAQRAAKRKYANSDKGKLRQAQYVAANKTRVREYHAEWIKENRAKASAYVAKWRKENPKKYASQILRYAHANKEKIRAYKQFRKALNDGSLVRPKSCQHCGKTGRIDAHHHNGYDHPLDVLWLCRQCHRNEHPS